MKRFNALFFIACTPLYLIAGCCDGKNSSSCASGAGCCAGQNYCLVSCAPGSGCCCNGDDCCQDSSVAGNDCCSKKEVSSVKQTSNEKNQVQELVSKVALEQAIKDHAFVVVDFHATWCGPCCEQDAILRAIAEKYQNVYFVTLDIDEQENRILSNAYGIERIPTLLFFKNGIIKKCAVGIQQEAQFKTILDGILK
jgi:thioredoxin 1